MNPASKSRGLEALARLHGIATSYVNAMGQTQVVSPATLTALLAALGVPVKTSDELDAAWEQAQTISRCLPPVTVAWCGDARPLSLCCADPRSSHKMTGRIRLEDGSTRAFSLRVEPLAGKQRNPCLVTRLPNLPEGYHQIEVRIGKQIQKSLLICSPQKAYSPSRSRKQWGVFAPIYALRSNDNWGAGDLRDLQELSRWVHSRGGTMIGTLPLMSAFLDRPFEPSPYSPASRLFWNEFYLHVPQIPEFTACVNAQNLFHSSGFTARLKKFRQSPTVNYAEEMANKRAVLELMAEFFFSRHSERRRAFDRFLRDRPQLKLYAQFRAVTEQRQSGWMSWPDRVKGGKFAQRDFSKSAEQYHMYVQWCVQQQMDQIRAQSAGGGTLLYLDLPLGVNPDSFDAWRYRDVFAQGVNGGAPPDGFFTKGQDWGFAPLHPQEMRQSGYHYYLEFLRMQMRHTGLLRLDHVMGLHRLYWIPRGFPASEGSYVHYPAEELYAILCLESHRHKTALVGENLGTVPPEVNKAMTHRGIKQMYVVEYEQQPDPRAALRAPPKESVASLNTHDMATFAAHWNGLDIVDRADLGLLPRATLPAEKRARLKANRALVQFLRRKKVIPSRKRLTLPDILRGCLRFLSRSDAEFVLINLEDLWLETRPQNTPSTSHERLNWRRKMRLSLEQIQDSINCRGILTEIDEIRRLGVKRLPQKLDAEQQ